MEYTGTIDDVDELINPRMLAHHFLGPEPSPYVLRTIAKEEKSKYSSFRTLVFLLLVSLLTPYSWWSFVEMATKFNQELYAKMRAKKNEPLSNLAQKRPRAAKKVMETTTSTLVTFDPKAASPTASVKEITPCPKKAHGGGKGKSKVDANIWDDATTVMGRAHNVVIPKELKDLNSVPSHELVSRHIHKLV